MAKEFVASRSDEEGVLILSLFAERAVSWKTRSIGEPLRDNRRIADAIDYALEMAPQEKEGKNAAHAARGKTLQYLPLATD